MHSIIIPHRNRHTRLGHCLRSIARSARITGLRDHEVVVADLNSFDVLTAANRHCSQWRDGRDRDYYFHTADDGFNKCHALNQGLQLARGSTITFLDADAIVGPRWLEGVRLLDDDPSLVRLCYRVWLLDQDQERQLAEAEKKGEWETQVAKAFAKCGPRYPDEGGLKIAWESYHQVNHNWFKDPKHRRPDPEPCGPHVFGNSQFSMRREDIGDLRFDEEGFPHSGFEDLDFIEQIRAQFGEAYKARILRDPQRAMIHIQSPGEKDWHRPDWVEEQKKRYMRKWYSK